MNPVFELEDRRGGGWRRLLPVAAILIVLIPLGGILLSLGAPRLVEVSPGVDAQNVPAYSELRLTFSRPMDPQSVAERLTIQPENPGAFQWQGATLIFAPDEPWPNGATVRVRLAAGARAAGWPSLALRDESAWGFRIGQPRLIFLFPSDGPANIYQYSPTSGEFVQLTNSLTGVLEFDAAADGSALYYSQNSPEEASYILRLPLNRAVASTRAEDAAIEPESAELEVAEPQKIITCPQAVCRAPRLAPDGNLLAYERTGLVGGEGPLYPQVWLAPISPDGKMGEPYLAGAAGDQTVQPAWSPAGWLTFYNTTNEMFVATNPATGERRTFTNSTGQPGDWDPEGRFFVAPEISFLSPTDTDALPDLEQLAASHLLRYHLLDNVVENLSQDIALEDAAPAYSPDGGQLACARKFLDPERWTPGHQLWVMNADGSSARPLTNEPFYNHYDFAWSPTGGQLAYVRFEETELTDPPEIWLVDLPGGAAQRVALGGYAPYWLP
ncbi:MAG TPA: Ig-like domain-containing protein [Anaerolineales bacterium]|nr:Ig-like domain-containing protein [Anaerolineales bacterium]